MLAMTMETNNIVGRADAVRVVLPYGPDVVFAPPAFKGQQSAKGATKARFEMIAARLAAAQVSR